MNLDLELIRSMTSDKISNYALAGLTSSLVGTRYGKGRVRLFEMGVNQINEITPHSHRFDFQCVVLAGTVTNRIWEPSSEEIPGADFCQETMLTCPDGKPGEYVANVYGRGWYLPVDTVYTAGETYSMKADEIHSIEFAKGTSVLFFEGPTLSNSSLILEPVINGTLVKTFKVEDWMFQREGA